MKCPNVDIYNLDKELFQNIDKIGGWEKLTKIYNKEAKDKKNYLESDTNLQVKNFLEYMGALRKIIIDVIVKKTTDRMSKDKKHKSKYKSFLKNNKFNKYIIASALGSTNLTSDYDITFGGPGSYLLIKCIIENFNKIKLKKMPTMTQIFDSNFYLMPDLVITKNNMNRFKNKNINLFQVNGTHMIPVPNSKDITSLELLKLKNKKDDNRKLTSNNLKKRYNKLLKLGEEMDVFLYQDNFKNSSIKNKLDFFNKIMEIKETEIEAYFCLSTVLTVVYGIQSKKIDDLEKILIPDNFLVGAIENIIDLYKHHSHSFVNNQEKIRNLSIKVSKYIYRIFFNLDYYLKKGDSKTRQKCKQYFKKKNINYEELKKLTNEILFFRKNSDNFSPEERGKYIQKIDKFIKVFKLNKPLKFGKQHEIFDLFKELDERTLFLYKKKSKTIKRTNRKKGTKKKTRKNR